MILIAAIDNNRGLGLRGGLPWNIPEDRAFFRNYTAQSTLIFGSTTYNNMNAAHPGLLPFPGTECIKLHKGARLSEIYQHPDFVNGYLTHHQYMPRKIFICGGSKVYDYYLNLPKDFNGNHVVNRMVISHIDAEYNCDTYFKDFDKHVKKFRCTKIIKRFTDEKSGVTVTIKQYGRKKL